MEPLRPCWRELILTVCRHLRKRLIGKNVHVTIDYVKPAEGDYEEKECVTIKYGGASKWVHRSIVTQLLV